MFRSLTLAATLAVACSASAQEQVILEAEVAVTDYLNAQTFDVANATITVTVDPDAATESGAPISECTDTGCRDYSVWNDGITSVAYVLTTPDGVVIAEGSFDAGADALNLTAIESRDNVEEPDNQTLAYYYTDSTGDIEVTFNAGWVGETLENFASALEYPSIDTAQNISVLTQFAFTLDHRPGGVQSASFDANGMITAVYPPSTGDADGDGFADADDACPESDAERTVRVGNVNSRVPNILLGDGCTINDLFEIADEETRSHRDFVHEVTAIARALAEEGAISRWEKYRIVKAAIKSKKRHYWKKAKKWHKKKTKKHHRRG